MKGDNNADRVPVESARDTRDFVSDVAAGLDAGEAAAVVLGRAALPKPDCKCGRPYHSGKYYGGVLGQRRCDGYEPIQSDTDIPSSKEHGGQLASLDPECPHKAWHDESGGYERCVICGVMRLVAEFADSGGSSKEYGGQLAALHPDEQRAMLRAHRLTRLREALDVCRAEAEERSDYDGEDFGAYLRRTQYAMFAGGVQYLEACIAVLAGEVTDG